MNQGFTLVELVIVVAILAVLSAIVAPQYIKYVERSHQGVDASTLESMRRAVETEVAILKEATDATVVITGATGTISSASLDSTFIDEVEKVVGSPLKLKSKAAKGMVFTICIEESGLVTWNTSDATSNNIAALHAGKAVVE